MSSISPEILQSAIFNILPNPVLVKDPELRYVSVNQAFEELFNVTATDVIGKQDQDIFPERQAVHCTAGDRHVLESGEIDEAYETVFRSENDPREIVTRKSRLTLPNGSMYLVGIIHDISELSLINRRLEEHQRVLESQTQELARMAHTDPLTGCSNRWALYATTGRMFEQQNGSSSLLVMDIDRFKQINDTYGHSIGDLALVHFANTVKQTIRKDDRLVRLGGEEFAVLLPNASEDESRCMAERICEVVRSTPLLHDGQEIRVTVSIGAVHVPHKHNVDLDSMLNIGDKRLYKAKSAGRNRVVFA